MLIFLFIYFFSVTAEKLEACKSVIRDLKLDVEKLTALYDKVSCYLIIVIWLGKILTSVFCSMFENYPNFVRLCVFLISF